MSVRAALTEFVDHTLKAYPELEAPFDPDWRSPCELGEPYDTDRGRLIAWRPVPRHPATIETDFAPLERALEVEVHPDIKAYYGAYWSAGLEAEAVDGHVSLLFLWNQDDVARLNENLLGHAFARGARAKARPPRSRARPLRSRARPLRSRARSGQSGRHPSVFFACTEPDSDLFLAVDNETGIVLLERPGRGPVREVAQTLTSFLETLVPRPPVLHR